MSRGGWSWFARGSHLIVGMTRRLAQARRLLLLEGTADQIMSFEQARR